MGTHEATNTPREVILATHNAGKVKELGEYLASLGWAINGMDKYGLEAPEETGGSFEANACLKAEAAHVATGLWTIADDSGLEVDALDGAPGVDTAYYGGWEKLLVALQAVPVEQRGAQFVCVLALTMGTGVTVYFKGICKGSIALKASGDGGFGYDPVFVPAGQTMTFADMTKAEKYKFSHRGQALHRLAEWIAAGMPERA